MIWYLAPTFAEPTDDKGAVRFVPGHGEPLRKATLGPFIAHAHAPKDTPTTCLVGMPVALEPVLEGWMRLDLDEARSHFEEVTGRAPSKSEVW